VKDYYSTLGLSKTATADEIEEAYRVLSDPQQRAAHDNPRPDMSGFGFRSQPFDFDNIFNMFGAQFTHPQQRNPRSIQARMSLWIQLSDVASGGKRTVSVGSHTGTQIVEIEVPLGVEDGATVAYPGLAPGGIDLIVTFRIHPNPKWQRDGFNLYTEQKVSIWTLIAGGEITVKDILNRELSVAIPPMMQPGQMLRCRGRGLPDRANNPGDMMIRVQAEIPQPIPDELLALIRQQTGR
jgi:curved DNA-binding protein